MSSAPAYSLVREPDDFKLLTMFGFGLPKHPAADCDLLSQSTECWSILQKSHTPHLYSKSSTHKQFVLSPFSFPNLYRHLYSQHLLPHYLIHLISYFLLVWFPLALLPTPVSSLLRFKALGIWSCAQLFPSCECTAVSQVVSRSRCSDVCLPPSTSLLLCSLSKHQIALMVFSIQRVPNSWPQSRLCFQAAGDERQCRAFLGHNCISYF